MRRANITSISGVGSKSGSVRTTIPGFVAATLGLELKDLIVWTLHEDGASFKLIKSKERIP